MNRKRRAASVNLSDTRASLKKLEPETTWVSIPWNRANRTNITTMSPVTNIGTTVAVRTAPPRTTTPSTTKEPISASSNFEYSTTGAVIIGIGIGTLMVIILYACFVVKRHRRRKNEILSQMNQPFVPQDDDGNAAVDPPQQSHLIRFNPSARSSRVDFAPSSSSQETDSFSEGYGPTPSWQVQRPSDVLPIRTIPSSQVKLLKEGNASYSSRESWLPNLQEGSHIYTEHPNVRGSIECPQTATGRWSSKSC